MTEKDIRMAVDDGLGIALALLKTANMAIGNAEYFGDDGQSIAITLDIIVTRLGKCREMLRTLDEGQQDI